MRPVASESATKSLKAGLPQVVCNPATLKLSLIVMGTPCSGPVASPRAVASSAAAASCNAASRRSSTTAFSAGLTASIRACSISVSSREENSLRRTACAASVADWNSGVSLIFFASVQFVTIASWNSVRYVSLFSPSSPPGVTPHAGGRIPPPGTGDREVVVLTRMGIDRNGGVDEDPVAIHQDADAPLRALSSSGKMLTKSERRVMSKIST